MNDKQRETLAAMPEGEWVRANGSVTYSALERLGLVESRSVREHRQYGKSPSMPFSFREYRRV